MLIALRSNTYLKCKNWHDSALGQTHVTRQREKTPFLSKLALTHSRKLFGKQLEPVNQVQQDELQSSTSLVSTSTVRVLLVVYCGKLKMACNFRRSDACTKAHVSFFESARVLSCGIQEEFLLWWDRFRTSYQWQCPSAGTRVTVMKWCQ